jgi:hypothetical protein
MQATAVTTSPVPAPAAQAAPAVAGPPTQITITGPDGTTQTIAIPQTRAELRAIRDARRSLSDQITSAMGRRDEVATELRKATDAVDRQGLEKRLTVLDTRIAQLENELAVTGKQLTMAPASLNFSTEFPSGRNGNMEVAVPIVSVITMFVIFPLVFVRARNMWRRGSSSSNTVAQLPADTTNRLERLEAGVEAIAIEVERISEGQRFVTKLLSDSAPGSRIPTLAAAETVGEKK